MPEPGAAMLQLSVFVVDLPAEMGSWEGSRVGEGPAQQYHPILNGPQPLQRSSLLEIFRDGQAEVQIEIEVRGSGLDHLRCVVQFDDTGRRVVLVEVEIEVHVELDVERVKHWIGNGAQLTDKVAVLYTAAVKSADAPAAASA